MDEPEEVLTGGNVAAEVVRVGRTVRKPVTVSTPAVGALQQHLEAAGFDGSPRHLGLDDAGRQILEYVPGRDGYAAGRNPWARLWIDGHGDHWGPAADYIERNEDVWTAALLG